VKRILVVKLRHLGDVLLTSPVFQVLKNHLPEASIDAFIWSESLPMLEGHPALQDTLLYDRSWKKLGWRKWVKEIALFREIRKRKYDVVINLTEGDRGAFAAHLSKAPIRIGFQSEGRRKKDKIYTHLAKPCPTARHTVERNLDALRRMGIFPSLEERELFLYVPEQAKQKVKELLGDEPFVLIHPASRWRFKCYPQEKMRALVKALLQRGEKVVVAASADAWEQGFVKAIVEGTQAINLAGKLSLKELAALIEMSKALISVDSVSLHMASALKTPVVALFGPTSELNWGPWQHERSRVVTVPLSCRPCCRDGCGGSKVSDCLERIAVEQVLQAYDSVSRVYRK